MERQVGLHKRQVQDCGFRVVCWTNIQLRIYTTWTQIFDICASVSVCLIVRHTMSATSTLVVLTYKRHPDRYMTLAYCHNFCHCICSLKWTRVVKNWIRRYGWKTFLWNKIINTFEPNKLFENKKMLNRQIKSPHKYEYWKKKENFEFRVMIMFGCSSILKGRYCNSLTHIYPLHFDGVCYWSTKCMKTLCFVLLSHGNPLNLKHRCMHVQSSMSQPFHKLWKLCTMSIEWGPGLFLI